MLQSSQQAQLLSQLICRSSVSLTPPLLQCIEKQGGRVQTNQTSAGRCRMQLTFDAGHSRHLSISESCSRRLHGRPTVWDHSVGHSCLCTGLDRARVKHNSCKACWQMCTCQAL